jgi:hypothetical protein
MFRNWKLSTIGLAAILIVGGFTFAHPSTASARPPGVFIGGGVGFYGPGWYGPYWGPNGYYYGPYGDAYAVPNAGTVKFGTKMKEAAVYVDGGYAGLAKDLKNFRMRPGNYNIELRAPDGRTIYQQKIDVIAGKTVKIIA